MSIPLISLVNQKSIYPHRQVWRGMVGEEWWHTALAKWCVKFPEHKRGNYHFHVWLNGEDVEIIQPMTDVPEQGCFGSEFLSIINLETNEFN